MHGQIDILNTAFNQFDGIREPIGLHDLARLLLNQPQKINIKPMLYRKCTVWLTCITDA